MLEEQRKKLKNRQTLIRVVSVLLFLALLTYLTIKMFPQMMWLSKPENIPVFVDYIRGKGIKGVLVFLLIQVSQVIIALIPGEPVEIVAGVLYGGIGGLLICMLGVFIGSIIVFFLVKYWGMSVVTIFVSEKRIQELWFLRDKKKFELLTFILFFVPGTPKDLLTYAAGLTTIEPIRFFIIATIARIPSILTSTLAGKFFLEGNTKLSIAIFGVAGLLGVIGYYLHKFVVSRRSKQS